MIGALACAFLFLIGPLLYFIHVSIMSYLRGLEVKASIKDREKLEKICNAERDRMQAVVQEFEDKQRIRAEALNALLPEDHEWLNRMKSIGNSIMEKV